MKLKNFNYHQISEILNNPLHFSNAKPSLKVIVFDKNLFFNLMILKFYLNSRIFGKLYIDFVKNKLNWI